MIEFKEQYSKLPNNNQWGAALSSVVSFMNTLQIAVKNIDARLTNIESYEHKNDGGSL